jgi:VanZ family protein
LFVLVILQPNGLSFMNVRAFIPAIVWFVIATVLLCLPGDDLPRSHFFDIPHFDKYVHLSIFFLLVALFSYPLINTAISIKVARTWFTAIAALGVVYGIGIEFIQKYLVKNRSFDAIDIVFDATGCFIALLGANWYVRKKIGPDRNRGRNQN